MALLISDKNHDKIHDAADQLKKAIEAMGMKNVVILYVYSEADDIHNGYLASGIVQAVGACEYIKNSVLTDLK